MKTKLFCAIAATMFLLVSGMTSCKKDEGTARMQVRMMDAPAEFNFDAIFLDVVGVEVKMETAEHEDGEWISLQTGAGVYNIMTLVNGTDVLLSDEEVPAGRLKEVRLILSDHNTIVVGGISYPLIVPSGAESGLKIKMDEDVRDGATISLMLDFDAAHSINVQGSGTFQLKPVLHGVILQRTGSIHGNVTATNGAVAIVATASMDASMEYTTYADRSSGEFLLRGVAPGTYTVEVYYPGLERPTIYTDVVVSANAVTEVQ